MSERDRRRSGRDALDRRITSKLNKFVDEDWCSMRDVNSEDVLSQLREISVADAMDALEKVESTYLNSTVRNLPAYLAGVIRRITQLSPTSEKHDSLHPEAQFILDQLYATGTVRRNDIDARSMAKLTSAAPEFQLLVMETFRDRNLQGIRNMAAFFTSHQSLVERDLHDGRLRLPRLKSPPPPLPTERGGNFHQQHPHHHGGGGPLLPPPPPPPEHHHASHPSLPSLPPGGRPYDPEYPTAPALSSRYDTAPPLPQYQSHQPPPPGQGQGGYAEVPPHHYPRHPAGPAGPMVRPPQPQQQHYGAPIAPPQHYKDEQGQWGIRIDEFQALSSFAIYVHPAVGLRLQQLWDVDQNKLVSVLNEASWESLAGLDAVNGLAAVNECAEAMKSAADDLVTVNSLFIRTAAKFPKRPNAPTLATIALAAANAAEEAAAAAAAAGVATARAPPSLPPPQQQQAPAYSTQPPPPQQQQQQQYPYSTSTQPPPLSYQQQQQPYGGAPPPPTLPAAAATGGHQPPPPYGGHHPPPPQQQQQQLPISSYVKGGNSDNVHLPPLPAPGAAQMIVPPPLPLPDHSSTAGEHLGALPEAIYEKIYYILREGGGLLQPEHITGKAIEIMQSIGERNTLSALDNFGQIDPTQMRSPTGYLIGCLRKYGKDNRRSGGGASRRNGGGGGRREGGGARNQRSRYEPY